MSEQQISPKNPLPTDFSRAVGQRIREARDEHRLSQAQLANRIERRQAAVSDMENGRMEPDATTLVMLSKVLEKPLLYFFPDPWGDQMEQEGLSIEEKSLLKEFRKLQRSEYRQIALHQLKALTKMNL